MLDALTRAPVPVNEPVRDHAPGSAERDALVSEIERQRSEQVELTMTIGGEQVLGGGEEFEVVEPHAHASVLGLGRHATPDDVARAVAATKAAAPAWRALSYDARAAVFLRAAELLAGPWRATINASTVLGQSKTAYQAEIDAVCELADFWRFNAHYGKEVLAQQPTTNSVGVWNRMDHRPLEGFVVAITPFNFTSIAANLATAPALMGNTVIWKPSPTQTLSAWWTMRLLESAGLPPGVINLVTGDGAAVSEVALTDRDLAGVHFTGSTATFRSIWSAVGARLADYRSYPRLVGETGGKDFVLAHPTADPAVLVSALVRGAFEYQGQKCSAASRAYIPRSVWLQVADRLAAETEALTMGPTSDLDHFLGAVIDERAFARHAEAIARARSTPGLSVIAGGEVDDSIGWFVRPTIVLADDPEDEIMTTELFGPILGVHVFDDEDYDAVVDALADSSDFALTGAVVATDRHAIEDALERLRFAAGNVYVNDKPTGAVVGQQPFGGARGSGTNDKAGSPLNLLRWTSPRAIKENLAAPTAIRHAHQG